MPNVKSFRTVLLLSLLSLFIFAPANPADKQRVPDFSATTLDGETYTNSSVNGNVVLVQLWATWCKYCRAEQSTVDRIDREFSRQGLITIAVDVNEDRQTVEHYLASRPRACHIVLTRNTNLVKMFPPHTFPTYILIDREGNIAGTQFGSAGEDGLRRLLRRAGLVSR